MILVKCRVMPSFIHGLGLFATEEIPKGTVVWRYDNSVDFRLPESDPVFDDPDWKKHADFYGFKKPGDDHIQFCGDAAMFLNHSDEPNLSKRPNVNWLEMVANRDIHYGEELLEDYYEYDEEPESGGELE